jgi:hypothetical protein
MSTTFWFESLKETDYHGDLNIDGKMILKQISGKVGWRADFIHLAHDRDQ